MPRLKERSIRFKELQQLLRGYFLNGTRIAPVIGVSGPTGRKKLENPELFTLKDLWNISKVFGIPWSEIKEAMKFSERGY